MLSLYHVYCIVLLCKLSAPMPPRQIHVHQPYLENKIIQIVMGVKVFGQMGPELSNKSVLKVCMVQYMALHR